MMSNDAAWIDARAKDLRLNATSTIEAIHLPADWQQTSYISLKPMETAATGTLIYANAFGGNKEKCSSFYRAMWDQSLTLLDRLIDVTLDVSRPEN